MLGIRAFQPYHQILYVDSVNSVDITNTLLHWNVMTCIDSIDIYRIWCILRKPWFLAFQNFFGLKIRWILRKLWAETCVCILYRLYWHNIAFEPLKHDVLWSLVSTVSTWDTTHNALLTLLWSLCIDCFDTRPLPFNVHMCDKVTMSVNQWLPCYLTRIGSMCNSKYNSK